MRTLHFSLVGFALLASCADACDRIEEMVKPEEDAPRSLTSPDQLLSQDATFLPQSQRGNGIAMDNYTLVVGSGENLTIFVTSTAFDPVLHVTPPGNSGTLINDDFQGDRTRSQLSLATTEAGTLKVAVTSYQPGAQGVYHIEVGRSQGTTSEGQSGPAPVGALLTIGERRQGQIDTSDAQLPDGRRYEIVPVTGADAGTQLQLSVTSSNPSLSSVLLDPNGAVTPGNGQPGGYLIAAPGAHRLQLMAPNGAAAAVPYELSLAQASGTATPQLDREHHLLPVGAQVQTVTLDRAVSGDLADSDAQLPSGERADVYGLTIAAANTPVRLELVSGTFDPYLMVLGPAGAHFENDDYAGTTNSMLEFSAETPGTYNIVVTSYRAEERGAYDLKISGSRGSPTPTPTPPPGESIAGTIRRDGELANGDSQLQSGEFADRYPFTWSVGTRVRIELSSTEFDPYLMVQSPSGRAEQNDDIESGNLNSALTYQVTEPGAHIVVVTTYRPGERGRYQLVLGPEGSGNGPPPTPPPTPPPSPTDGQTIDGTLGPGDSQLTSGEWADTHRVSLQAGEHVQIEARSTAFDTYLIVRPPSGPQQDNDDGPNGGTNAALTLVPGESGNYEVMVTSYRPGEQGPYQLTINRGGGGGPSPTPPSPPTPTPNPPAPPVNPQPGDAPIRGTLAAGDETLQSGEFVDNHVLRFGAGRSIQLRLNSDQFDTYLIVRTPSGRQLDNDDITPSNRNSGVDIPAAEAGDYTVMVTSYRPGETGAYVLSTGEGQAVPSPSGEGGQVYGLFAGISDYPGGDSDLPECANDAIKLAETLRTANLLTTDRQVVLTDGQATLANIRTNMQQMAARLRPDDIFVFFYSGHGGQNQGASDAREIDGTDEYLVMYDGNLLDDELGRMFDSVQARVSLINIDACFSGGFAKDLITRSGRVGMFSSEEDVVSAVAGQFQAGGYLSHFLRVGMAGEADADPADRVLTVGELTHYVYTQFGTHAADVHRASSYQHLVVDRGAVGVDNVLWSYR